MISLRFHPLFFNRLNLQESSPGVSGAAGLVKVRGKDSFLFLPAARAPGRACSQATADLRRAGTRDEAEERVRGRLVYKL